MIANRIVETLTSLFQVPERSVNKVSYHVRFSTGILEVVLLRLRTEHPPPL